MATGRADSLSTASVGAPRKRRRIIGLLILTCALLGAGEATGVIRLRDFGRRVIFGEGILAVESPGPGLELWINGVEVPAGSGTMREVPLSAGSPRP
jgi:hypothetical protein